MACPFDVSKIELIRHEKSCFVLNSYNLSGTYPCKDNPSAERHIRNRKKTNKK